MRRGGFEERVDRIEEPRTLRIRVGLGRRSQLRNAAPEVRHEAREFWRDGLKGDQLVVRAGASVRAEHVNPWLVRSGSVLVTPAVQHGARLGHSRCEVGGKTRLADARLAGEE